MYCRSVIIGVNQVQSTKVGEEWLHLCVVESIFLLAQPKMHGPRQTQVKEPFWAKVWADIEPAVRAIIGDTAVCLCLLVALSLIYLLLGWLAGQGYDEVRIGRFETMHYWATVMVLGIFLLSFVIRSAVIALKPRK
jgi:hypothetical protein